MKGFKKITINWQKVWLLPVAWVQKLLWFLARDAFLFLMTLVLLAILFGEFLFYADVLLVELKQPDAEATVVSFKENVYTSVITHWEERGTLFNKPIDTVYQNPFK